MLRKIKVFQIFDRGRSFGIVQEREVRSLLDLWRSSSNSKFHVVELYRVRHSSWLNKRSHLQDFITHQYPSNRRGRVFGRWCDEGWRVVR